MGISSVSMCFLDYFDPPKKSAAVDSLTEVVLKSKHEPPIHVHPGARVARGRGTHSQSGARQQSAHSDAEGGGLGQGGAGGMNAWGC